MHPVDAAGGPGVVTGPVDEVLRAARDEQADPVRCLRDGVDENRQPLPVELVTHEQHDDVVRPEPVRPAGRRALGVTGRAESPRVDAVADDHGGGRDLRVGRPQKLVLLDGEVDDDAVRPGPEPDRVAGQGEEVQRVPGHPEGRVPAGPHGGENDPVVDVDGSGQGVVVADGDRVRKAPEDSPGHDRPDRGEPDHSRGQRDFAGHPWPGLGKPGAVGVDERDPGRRYVQEREFGLEVVGHCRDPGSGADLGGDLDDGGHGPAATRPGSRRSVDGSTTSSLLCARAAAPIQMPAMTKGIDT